MTHSLPVLPALSRRAVLLGGGAAALSPWLPRARATPAEPKATTLSAAPGRAALLGDDAAETAIWGYDGHVPGPQIRIRQGEALQVVVENRLDQDTTVHWHGIRLPNAMDGVPGLTQAPIRPGERFTYAFAPPDAGTFWYHPHAHSLEQLGRGLAGVLIVEEAEPVPVDRDLVWMLADWRLTRDGRIAAGFGNGMEAAMAGRVGNLVTLNGTIPTGQPVRAGERVRLRLVNAAVARIMALRFEGHHPVVVAVDGQPCDPHEPEGGRLLLGPAMRLDIVVDMQGEAGKRYRVIDDFYDGLSYPLTTLAYESGPPLRAQPPDTPLRLPPNPLPKPDLATAECHELTLEGGMMGGGTMMGMGGMHGMGGGAAWTINGSSMTGDGNAGMPPLFTLRRGRTCVLTIRNRTAWWHPMHIHGFSFRMLSRNGVSVPHRPWSDTVLFAPKDTVECAFVADTPGDWMLHCHVMDHQMAGLMTVLRVA
ncbi:multicopper oxidase family protein [Inquilinus sp. NPDC058860]|uniref:multicopper oxidase family protein n=1 Tax=Inquilinus sp. NPDC058860 TaxID=3346652 RepID=UPI003688B3B3